MAKGQKALAADMKKRDEEDRKRLTEALEAQNTATTAAAQPTPAELQREAERKSYFDWKEKGDFRTPPPGLIGIGYGPENERRRAMERTALPTGIGGMGAGYASPTALALNREYMGNVNAQNDALNYQGALQGEDMYQRTGNSAAIIANDMARRGMQMSGANAGAGFAQNASQFSTGKRIENQPKSIWPALISGGLTAAGMFLGGPAFAGMMGSTMGGIGGAAAGGMR